MPSSLTQRSSSLIEDVGASPCVCGSWHTPMKFFGNSVQTRWIRSLQICVHSWLTAKSPMWWPMPEARGEKIVRSVPRSLLEFELGAFDAVADFVVGHFQARARRQRATCS